MRSNQRRDRDNTPSPLEFLFGRRCEREDLTEIEDDWIPFLERALDKARDLVNKLKKDQG